MAAEAGAEILEMLVIAPAGSAAEGTEDHEVVANSVAC